MRREKPPYQYDITDSPKSTDLRSQWLWVDQDDVLTPDEELVDVASVHLAVSLAVRFFLRTVVWRPGLQRGAVRVQSGFHGV